MPYISALSKAVYKMLKIKYLLPCLLITVSYAAQTCNLKGGGILDDIMLQFARGAIGWQTTIEPIAKKFFFILFGMEFMWQLTVKKVFAGDIEKVWVFFFTRTVLCFFFAQYLVNVEMYKGIIEFLSGLGASMGGFTLNMVPNGAANTLSPSEVISSFSCITDVIHTITDQTGSFQYITIKITLAIIQVLIFILLVSIAFYLMQIILQAYLIIYIGFLFAGFAGSSWTRNYWEHYLAAVITVGAKFLIVCVLMGVLNIEMQKVMINVSMASSPDVLSSVVIKAFGTLLITSMGIYRLPEWFAAIFSVGMWPVGSPITVGSALRSAGNFITGVTHHAGEQFKPDTSARPTSNPVDIVGGRSGNTNSSRTGEHKSPNPF